MDLNLIGFFGLVGFHNPDNLHNARLSASSYMAYTTFPANNGTLQLLGPTL